jgi:proteic killer suppression protein
MLRVRPSTFLAPPGKANHVLSISEHGGKQTGSCSLRVESVARGRPSCALGIAADGQPPLIPDTVRLLDRLVALEIAFAKKSLRQLCESERTARHSLGAGVAEKLKARLADLRAASSVKELVAGRPREMRRERTRQIAVDLCDGYRIVFCINHSVVPLGNRGRVDWSRVNRIKIVNIESKHV